MLRAKQNTEALWSTVHGVCLLQMHPNVGKHDNTTFKARSVSSSPSSEPPLSLGVAKWLMQPTMTQGRSNNAHINMLPTNLFGLLCTLYEFD